MLGLVRALSVLLFDPGGESGFDDVDQFCRADSGVD